MSAQRMELHKFSVVHHVGSVCHVRKNVSKMVDKVTKLIIQVRICEN